MVVENKLANPNNLKTSNLTRIMNGFDTAPVKNGDVPKEHVLDEDKHEKDNKKTVSERDNVVSDDEIPDGGIEHESGDASEKSIADEDVSTSVTSTEKHRPSSLDLKSIGHSDAAIRIVSPGLPRLNEEMKSTVKLSQKIEQQQRHLIAARHRTGSSSPNAGDITITSSITSTTSNSQGSDDMDRLLVPSSAKRLRRDNIPTPLSISAPARPPSIQSAPIRQNGRVFHPVGAPPQTSRQSYFRRYHQPLPSAARAKFQVPYHIQVQSYNQYQQQLRRQPVIYPQPYKYQHPIPTHSYIYGPQTATYPQAPYSQPLYTLVSYPVHYPQQRLAPKQKQVLVSVESSSPAQSSPEKLRKLGLSSPVTPKKRLQYQSNVTDVYHGDYTKVAPINSQPLSAQKEYFEVNKESDIDEDTQPQYISPCYSPPQYTSAPGSEYEGSNEIFGSINLMNESVFNFRIFNARSKLANLSDESSGLEGEIKLAKEKEKFMKICETSWNEFVASKF